MEGHGINRSCSMDDECDCYECDNSRLEEMQMQYIDAAGLGCAAICQHYFKHCLKHPMRDSSLQGHKYIWELWHGHDRRFFQMMRMRKPTLRVLIEKLVTLGGMHNVPGRVSLEESVAIFLLICGQGLTYTVVEERLQRSSETISNHFHMVLNAVCKLGSHMIKPMPGQFDSDPIELTGNSLVWPYFKDCIGAIDGTHIGVHVADHEKAPWMNRKGQCTTNVLAICDFSMCIIFATVGMEGSMHDSRVLNMSMRERKRCFPHPPPGKFFLADAGYPLMPGFLTPYRRTRYHLPEFRANRNMSNKEEVFNYRHSSLRSIIERTFGVLKKRWRVLNNMTMTHIDHQIRIIWACICLHNFIRRYDSTDLTELGEIPDTDPHLSSRMRSEANAQWKKVSREDMAIMEQFRDQVRDSIPIRP